MSFLYAAYFLSGVSALLFEVIWIRRLALALGSSPVSFAAVSSAVILGLGAGACVWSGAGSGRVRRPMLAPAAAEAAFGAISFLLLWLGIDRIWAVAGCASLSGVVLTSAADARRRGRRGDGVYGPGPFFGVNFVGGGLGVAAGGIFALPVLGMKALTAVAAALSFGAALLYLVAHRVAGAGTGDDTPRAAISARDVRLPASMVAITGGTALGSEILWGRWISQMAGSSAYTYFIVLAVTILGFGCGCVSIPGGRRRTGSRSSAARIFVLCSVFYPLLALVVLLALQERGVSVFRWFAGVRNGLPAATACVAAAVLFPILFASGRYFAEAIAGFEQGRASGYGFCVLANCLGSAAGGWLVPFVLVPRVGSAYALALSCATNVVPAWYLARGGSIAGCRRAFSPALGAAAFAILVGSLTGRPAVFSLPAGLDAFPGPRIPRAESTGAQVKPAYFREGPYSTVAVLDHAGGRALLVDGKPESHSVRDMMTQAMLSELPFLVAGESFRDVLLIGLGSGATLEALLPHSVRRIDCVEISPEVIDAAGTAFGRRAAFRDARVRITAADGRRYLREKRRRYDLIVSQPSNPWVMGSASLFTREAFRSMASALSPSGMAVVWFQAYGIQARDFREEVDTLISVFPHVLVFSFSPGDVIFLCSGVPRVVSRDAVEAGLRSGLGALRGVSSLGFGNWTDLLGGFFGGIFRDVRSPAEDLGPLNTDDLPRLEYSVALSIADRDPYPAYSAIDFPLEARTRFVSGLGTDSREAGNAMLEWGESASRLGFARFAGPLFQGALGRLGRRARLLNDLGVVAVERGNYNEARQYFEEAIAADPMNRTARENLAAIAGKVSR